MTSPLDDLRDQFYINVYPNKGNDRAPIATVELRNKQTGEKFKHALWYDKDDRTKAYMAKGEVAQDPQSVAQKPQPFFPDEDEAPF